VALTLTLAVALALTVAVALALTLALALAVALAVVLALAVAGWWAGAATGGGCEWPGADCESLLRQWSGGSKKVSGRREGLFVSGHGKF
jgi:hypothetical protein